MKKVYFTKLLRPSKKRADLVRPEYLGYLMDHQPIEGVQIAIGRSSKSLGGDAWRMLDYWVPYDVKTGMPLTQVKEGTRDKCAYVALAYFHKHTAEQYRAMLEDRLTKRMTAILSGEF